MNGLLCPYCFLPILSYFGILHFTLLYHLNFFSAFQIYSSSHFSLKLPPHRHSRPSTERGTNVINTKMSFKITNVWPERSPHGLNVWPRRCVHRPNVEPERSPMDATSWPNVEPIRRSSGRDVPSMEGTSWPDLPFTEGTSWPDLPFMEGTDLSDVPNSLKIFKKKLPLKCLTFSVRFRPCLVDKTNHGKCKFLGSRSI